MASIELLNGNGMFMVLLIAGASAMLLFRAQRRLGARQRQQAPSAERQRPRARSGGTSSGNSSSNRTTGSGAASSTATDNTPGRGSLALRNLADDYEHYQVQLYDMARSLTAELETKASSLRYLAQLADERIALLDQKLTELAEAEQSQPGQVRGVSLETPVGLDSPLGTDNPVGLSSLASYSSPASFDSPAKTTRPTTGEAPASTAQPGASPSRQQQVQALATSGLAADEIASRLALPIGEVELILALQRRM